LKVDRRRQGVEDMFVDDVRAIKDEDTTVSVVEDEDEAADKLG
jgi:hypothetical protein